MFRYYVDPNQVTGRYAEKKELEQDYVEVAYENSENPHVNQKAGLVIEVRYDKDGNVTGALIDGKDTNNTIIVSCTGAGKTRRVLVPYILSCIYAKHSLVIHDPKGEILRFVHSLLVKFGYRIGVLNFRDPMKGNRLNFLQEAASLWKKGEKDDAVKFVLQNAQILFSAVADSHDPFWTETGINLFLSYFMIAASLYEPQYVTLQTIHRIHIEGLEKKHGQIGLKTYLEEHRDEKSYELGMSSFNAPNETRESIFSVFSSGLQRVILSEGIADMLTDSNISVNDLASPEKPMALFIITRDEAPKTYSTVVASYVDMIYTTLIDLAQKEKDNSLVRPVDFIMEEFGNLAKLENINDMMTASRSRSIRLVLVLQSLCQLHLHYSEDEAKVLIGNAQNLVYMASTDMDLVEMISKRCGTRILPYINQPWPLLDGNRLTQLDKKKGETLMFLDRHHPYVAHLPDLSRYKMIQPVDKVDLPTREKVKVEYGLFSKAIDEIHEKKIQDMMNERRAERKKAMSVKKMTRQKMMKVPAEQKLILDEIIRDDRRQKYAAGNFECIASH